MIRHTDRDSAVKSEGVQTVVLSKSHFQFSAEHTDYFQNPGLRFSPVQERNELSCIQLGSIIKRMGELRHA